ncbi:MAG: hypothetical protein HY551_06430 [Elusimicrobia bacterium]|nr:hypothetical protein [Elusimicrobiota bacterium]
MNLRDARSKISGLLDEWSRPAPGAALVLFGVASLFGSAVLQSWLTRELTAARGALSNVQAANARMTSAVEEYQSLRALRGHDVDRLHRDISYLTRSRKTSVETTLKIQEEHRLLEKQWEVMTTYLFLDEPTRKIHLMRGLQSLESYAVSHAPPRAYGDDTPLPPLARVTSKERFAHPERGTYQEQADGQLLWAPPQAGTSVRANALGEYVIFTDSTLILHGPPRNPVEHENFPHHCLGLSLPVAQKLYAKSFIGAKILLKAPESQEEPPAAPVP